MQKEKMRVVGGTKANVTIPANGLCHFSPLDCITLPSGYRILGVVGFTTNSQYVYPYALTWNTDEWALQFKNTSASAVTTSITLYFLLYN
jgi:hypothetical protein